MYLISRHSLDRQKKQFVEEKKEIIEKMVRDEKWVELDALEQKMLNIWSMWKQRVDIVLTQDQPNTPEQLLETRSYLTMYNEVLLYLRQFNPNSELGKRVEVKQ